MKNLRIGAAVLNQTPIDWTGNLERIRRAITQAREAEASILCLPELCITGYGCEDMFLSPGILRHAAEQLVALLPDTKGLIVSVGLPVLVRNAVYNAAALIVDGELVGLAAKQHLAGDGIHYEPRWFDAWDPGAVETIKIGPHSVPVGDLIFTVGDVRIGFEICEDAWAAARPGAGLAEHGVDVLLNPSASHFAFGKHETRKRLVIEGSRAYGVAYVYTNLLGNESGRVIFDGGVLIAAAGELVAEGPRLGFDEVVLTTAIVDLDLTRGQQARTASTRPRLGDIEERAVQVDFEWPQDVPPTPAYEALPLPPKEEEFARAVPLGLFDYMRKSWSRGFMLSLSGGADSSAVAMLVSLMVDLGCEDLGEAGFVERLAYLKLPKKRKAIKHELLTCVYQSTRNSGDATLHSAKSLAEWIGAEWIHWSIDDVVEDYESIVEKAIGRELSWEQDDIARQNIQARVRAPGVWMLANIKSAILVSTSNRSEAAVGYATMDGDTSGGLSPIAGVDKAFLLHWLKSGRGPGGGQCAYAHRRAASTGGQADRRGRSDAVPDPRTHRGDRDPRQAAARRRARHAQGRVCPDPRQAAQAVGGPLLQTLVAQPVETRALRPLLPSRRSKPRPEKLVPLPDPVRRVPRRAGGVVALRAEGGRWKMECGCGRWKIRFC